MAPPTPPESQLPRELAKVKAERGGMGSAELAEGQRRRLLEAMVVAIAEHGYRATTVEQLIALAGASKRDFYLLFDSKQACFFATFDQIVERVAGQVERAVLGAEGMREQLLAVGRSLANLIEEEPEAVSLVLLDSLAAGPSANDPRQRSQQRFEALLRLGFERLPDGEEVSEVTARAIVIGLRRLVYLAIRDASAERLRTDSGELADWVLSYSRPRAGGAGQSAPAVPQPRVEELSWEEPPASPASRIELSQRERIMRAVGQLSSSDGYDKLTIPAISSAAGTSNQTFYAEFAGKQEAFLATFDALAAPVLAAVAAAFDSAPSWPRRAESAVAAFLSRLTSDRLFAETAFLQVPTIGRPGLARIDAVMDELEAILRQGAPVEPPELVGKAIIGGIWGAIRDEVMAGRRAELTDLHPQIVEFATVGFEAG